MNKKIKGLSRIGLLTLSMITQAEAVGIKGILQSIQAYCAFTYVNYVDICTCKSYQLEQYLVDQNSIRILADKLYDALLLKNHVPKENMLVLVNNPLFVEMFVDRCGTCHEAWPIIDLIKDDAVMAEKFIAPVLKQMHMTVVNARDRKSIQFQSQVHPNVLTAIIKHHPKAAAHFLCPSIDLFCALYSDAEFYPQAQDWMQILLQVIDTAPAGFNVLVELLIAHNALYNAIYDMLVEHKPAIKGYIFIRSLMELK